MQIKTIMRNFFIPIRMTNFRKVNDTYVGSDVGRWGLLYTAGQSRMGIMILESNLAEPSEMKCV